MGETEGTDVMVNAKMYRFYRRLSTPLLEARRRNLLKDQADPLAAAQLRAINRVLIERLPLYDLGACAAAPPETVVPA